ncbi:aminotransferase class I/II-fold pyridoxal phosphate-dependent enzyme [Umezawaea sp.]|uniref:aminotransferase class I/II-fold pyridoxal phosphate-dependent enzyme n=1 Tax=Umezawaea sp. TaxID=1955258 RepID=UPI002ED0FAC4
MRSLVESIAAHHFVDEDRIVVAGGTDELVLLLARTRGPVLVGGHTSHARHLRAAGVPVVELPLLDYRVPAAELCLRFERGVGLAFVSNPHDLTGTVLSAGSVRRICAAARHNGALVVFDETCAEYALGPDFTSARWWASHGRGVCVLRSFPEVPVGYLIGDPAVVERLGGPAVGAAGRSAAFDALPDRESLSRAREDNRAARALLCRGLAELGIEFIPSSADFVLARMPGRSDLADVGLADHVRIPVGRVDEVAHLIEDLGGRIGAAR